MHRKHPHRVLTALDNLLTDTRTRQSGTRTTAAHGVGGA